MKTKKKTTVYNYNINDEKNLGDGKRLPLLVCSSTEFFCGTPFRPSIVAHINYYYTPIWVRRMISGRQCFLT